MLSSAFKYKLLAMGLLGATFALDQASKLMLMFDVVPSRRDVITITSFFDIVHAWNYGVSFSLFAGHDNQRRWLLIVMTIAIALAVLVAFLRETRRLPLFAYALIIGGAVGNIFDRVVHKAVFDFLSFHIGSYYWPAFNVADSAIVLGVGLVFFDGVRQSRASKQKAES